MRKVLSSKYQVSSIRGHVSHISYLISPSSGFTLIELLLVIVVIGVITAIGVANYRGVRLSARDAQRRVEIGNISKSIESSRNGATNFYNYSAAKLAEDFPNLPKDPGGASWSNYCILTSTQSRSSIAIPSPANFTPPCPTPWVPFTNYLTPTPPFPTGTASWAVCARLETSNELFCKTSGGL